MIERSFIIPQVVERTGHVERSYDLFSRLLEERIVFLGTEINDFVANVVVAELLYLYMKNKEQEIGFYINSPGGSVSAGMAIYDTMQYVGCDVATYCIGSAASMATILLAAGTPGKRYALPNSRMMIHQPWGGTQGSASDILIQAAEIEKTKKRLNDIIARHTNQKIDKVAKDTDRDYFLSAEEGKAYGLVDEVLDTVKDAEKDKEKGKDKK